MWRKIKPYGCLESGGVRKENRLKIAESEKGKESNLGSIFYVTYFIYRKTVFASRPRSALKFKMSCFEVKKFMNIKNLIMEKCLVRIALHKISAEALNRPHRNKSLKILVMNCRNISRSWREKVNDLDKFMQDEDLYFSYTNSRVLLIVLKNVC